MLATKVVSPLWALDKTSFSSFMLFDKIGNELIKLVCRIIGTRFT